MNRTRFLCFRVAFVLLFMGLSLKTMAQAAEPAAEKAPDNRRQGLVFILQGSYCSPGADLAKRYGSNGEVGAGVFWKTRTNWFFGLEGVYLFGESVKENPLSSLAGAGGNLFSKDGSQANVVRHERGFKLPFVKICKLLPVKLGDNSGDLSGFMLSAGGGFLEHYIDYQDQSRNYAQIQGDYIQGYDRLTSGPALCQSIGFLASGNNGLANFMLSMEFMQGFTHSNRYNYDIQSRNNSRRLDLSYGVRLTWLIPALNFGTKGEYVYY